MNSLQDWLTNDPDPQKTMDLVKKKIDWKKKMSKEDPIGLMRAMMTKQEFNDFWTTKKEQEAGFLLNHGWSNDKEKSYKANWWVPQFVVSANPEHWDMVFRTKKYTLYPYFLLGNPFAEKSLNVTSRFQYKT